LSKLAGIIEEGQGDDMQEETVFHGKIGEVIHSTQPDGRVFERYRRPPGSRLIIIDSDGKILITKEFRQETGNVDLRLPGGKVRDSLEEYHELLASGEDIAEVASNAAIKEAEEETGLSIESPELLVVAGAGATVEWDLYYFVVKKFSKRAEGQALEHGEIIEVSWMTPDDLKQAIHNGRMQEWRSVGVLLGLVL
jgi:8-oxo-dGTP pyrophosphatase MutT (NUDIX family)